MHGAGLHQDYSLIHDIFLFSRFTLLRAWSVYLNVLILKLLKFSQSLQSQQTLTSQPLVLVHIDLEMGVNVPPLS